MIDFKKILQNYSFNNGIYVSPNLNIQDQKHEINLRSKIAKDTTDDPFKSISKHHSIRVMDEELLKFLSYINKNSIILDVGSGWCWHWRNINKIRPDIKIFAIDILAENFRIANTILSIEAKSQIFFVNENILETLLPKNYFDAVWSVQCLQHIPKYNDVIKNLYLLIKSGGIFKNYNLNYNLYHKLKNFGKSKKTWIKNLYYLNRDIDEIKLVLQNIFLNKVKLDYSEILFFPKLKNFDRFDLLGLIDCHMTGNSIIHSLIARQVSLTVKK